MTGLRAGKLVIRRTKRSDIAALKNHLRREDLLEISASHGAAPEETLLCSRAVSAVCMTATLEGRPVAIFGLAPYTFSGARACVWMLGTDKLNRVRKSFVRLSRLVIGEMLALYPVLDNYVDARYVKAVRWLEVLGAKFEAAAPFGTSGLSFRHFIITRRDLWARQI